MVPLNALDRAACVRAPQWPAPRKTLQWRCRRHKSYVLSLPAQAADFRCQVRNRVCRDVARETGIPTYDVVIKVGARIDGGPTPSSDAERGIARAGRRGSRTAGL